MESTDAAPLASSLVLVAFDLETTGVDPFTDVPVSFGFVKRTPDSGVKIRQGYVNPGVPIPESATAIHGITDEMVAPAPDLVAGTEYVANLLATTWRDGGAIVGMNVSYDLTMVESLCSRLGLPTLTERGLGPVLDVLVVDRHVDQWRRGGRKLTDLCAHYGVTLGDAHDATADATASLEVLEVMLTRHARLATIPRDSINETLGEWYRTWLTDFSEYLEKKGEPPVEASRYGWPLHTPAA